MNVKSAVKNINGSVQEILLLKKNEGNPADSAKSTRHSSGAMCHPSCALLLRGCASSIRPLRITRGQRRFPIDPETGQRADYKDPGTWGTLEEAIAGCAHFGADGVGYAFISADNIVGLDLDNCRNRATGKIDQWGSLTSSMKPIRTPKSHPAAQVCAYSSMGSGGTPSIERKDSGLRGKADWKFIRNGSSRSRAITCPARL